MADRRSIELELHPFVGDVLAKGVAVDKLLGNRKPMRVNPKYSREPDEHEFYLMRVAASIADLLACWQQLNQIPILLANHRQTASMEKAGINRHSLIVYHIENYLIRTQSLLDRVLKLVDAIFHLTNSPRNCRYDVIMKNVKIEVSEIPASVSSLRTLLQRYAGVRNEIVHHHSIRDDALRRLDMFFLLERWERISPKEKPSNIREHIKDTIFEVLWFKTKELREFNTEITTSMATIFDKLAPYFTREEQALRLRLGKP